jgi:hypothetical protein
MPPKQRYTITYCLACGGLVGWEELEQPWTNECPGGVICKRERGTRKLEVVPSGPNP